MPKNYTQVATGVVDGLAIVSTAPQALPNDKGRYSDQIAIAIENNVKDGSTFPGNYLPNPRLNGSDDIYFTTWPDGGYRIYVNPNIPVSADTTVGDKNFNVTIISDTEIKINHHHIHIFSDRNAKNLEWKKFDCKYIFDATGSYLTLNKCSEHDVDYVKKSPCLIQ